MSRRDITNKRCVSLIPKMWRSGALFQTTKSNKDPESPDRGPLGPVLEHIPSGGCSSSLQLIHHCAMTGNRARFSCSTMPRTSLMYVGDVNLASALPEVKTLSSTILRFGH